MGASDPSTVVLVHNTTVTTRGRTSSLPLSAHSVTVAGDATYRIRPPAPARPGPGGTETNQGSRWHVSRESSVRDGARRRLPGLL